MPKPIIHSDNPNLKLKHPYNRKTWACKCGVINLPEAPECKMILILKQHPDFYRKNVRGKATDKRTEEHKAFEHKMKAQSAEIEAEIASWKANPHR